VKSRLEGCLPLNRSRCRSSCTKTSWVVSNARSPRRLNSVPGRPLGSCLESRFHATVNPTRFVWRGPCRRIVQQSWL
jgi:hypothetical protein